MVVRKGSGSGPAKHLKHRLEVNRTSYMLTLKNTSVIQIYDHTITVPKDVSSEKKTPYIILRTLLDLQLDIATSKISPRENPPYTFTRVKSAIAIVAFHWAG